MRDNRYISDSMLRLILIVPIVLGGVLVALLAYSLWSQSQIEKRGASLDSAIIREQQDVRHKQDEVIKRLDVLEASLEADHKFYGNRGIVQKELLNRAIQRGWFSAEEERILRQVAGEANYPK
jgi:hypothetical protein